MAMKSVTVSLREASVAVTPEIREDHHFAGSPLSSTVERMLEPAPTPPKSQFHFARHRETMAIARKNSGSRRVRDFYREQEDVLESFEEADRLIQNTELSQGDTPESHSRIGDMAINISLLVNVLLLVAKIVALVQSNSVAVLGSVIDSCLDLFSGLVIFLVSSFMRKRNRYEYPFGKGRFDALATVVIASVMVTAAFEIIRRAVEEIATDSADAKLNTISLVLMSLTVVVKFALFILCYALRGASSMMSSLATDHLNDSMSNAVALLGGGLATYWSNADPTGAIIIGFVIMYNWYKEGRENILNLAGRGASLQMIQKLTYIAMHHDPRVLLVDTVRAIHLGSNCLVEVDIVLPPEMALHEAHDIGESLQHKLELLEEVDRAYVHLDYETDHGPEDEHKKL
eukprot:m.27669 g.27669  ORF g.27669 m.27669 type:complete len:401 (+) comp7920_c0_seq1:105-1307(+)